MINAEIELAKKKAKRIRDIEEQGIGTAGKSRYIKYLKGERLTQRQAIIAYCYDCQGWYMDGREPCPDPLCPLYPYAPFTHSKEDAVDCIAGASLDTENNGLV